MMIDGDGSKPWYLVNPKIAGKWMFIPLKIVLIGIDPSPDIYRLADLCIILTVSTDLVPHLDRSEASKIPT